MSENGTEPQAGVLGNLPHSRPSVRSPRRTAPATGRAPRADADRPDVASATSSTDEQAPSQADLEALARTGIAIAGGAATLGLRIAGRAAAAVRGAVERR